MYEIKVTKLALDENGRYTTYKGDDIYIQRLEEVDLNAIIKAVNFKEVL